jgi:hypothetical protein
VLGGGAPGSAEAGFRNNYSVTGNNVRPYQSSHFAGNTRYAFDPSGKTVQTWGWHHGGQTAPRDARAQVQVTVTTGIKGLHGSHMHPHAAGGDPGQHNLQPLYRTTNLSHVKVVENQGTRWEKVGHHVHMTTGAQHTPGSPLPSAITHKVVAFDPKTGNVARDPATGHPLVLQSWVNASRPLTAWGKAQEVGADGRNHPARPALEGMRPGERGN